MVANGYHFLPGPGVVSIGCDLRRHRFTQFSVENVRAYQASSLMQASCTSYFFGCWHFFLFVVVSSTTASLMHPICGAPSTTAAGPGFSKSQPRWAAWEQSYRAIHWSLSIPLPVYTLIITTYNKVKSYLSVFACAAARGVSEHSESAKPGFH
jgi:hypothetical protein